MNIIKKILSVLLTLISLSAAAQKQDSVKTIAPVDTAQSETNPDTIIRKYIDAIGGEAAIKKIKDIKTVRTATVQLIPITITEIKKQPDQLKITVEGANTILQKVVVNKDKGYQENQGKKADLSQIEILGTKAEADLLSKLHPDQYNATRRYMGIQKVDTILTHMVEEMDVRGKTYQYYYDIKTGFLIRKAGNEATPQGPMPTITTYSNYMEVANSGGYKIPGTIRQEVGAQVTTSYLKSSEVNTRIQDKEFE
jgi:hypothetical protein